MRAWNLVAYINGWTWIKGVAVYVTWYFRRQRTWTLLDLYGPQSISNVVKYRLWDEPTWRKHDRKQINKFSPVFKRMRQLEKWRRTWVTSCYVLLLTFCVHFFSFPCTIVIITYLVILIRFGKKYKSWSSSWRCLLCPLPPVILLVAPRFQTLIGWLPEGFEANIKNRTQKKKLVQVFYVFHAVH